MSGSSAPPATIASTSCGEKKRLRRASRSSWATCSWTRSSSVRFHSPSWAAWAWTVSYSDLIRSSDRTRASSSGWFSGFVRKSSAPASSPRMRSWAGSSAVTITTGRMPVAGLARSFWHTS